MSMSRKNRRKHRRAADAGDEEIGSLTVADDRVDAVAVEATQGEWEQIPKGITIDSGAAESVIPPSCLPQYPTRPSEVQRQD